MNQLQQIHKTLDHTSDGRRFPRYRVAAMGKLISIAPGLSSITTRTCQILDISQTGAGLLCTTAIGLPDHYYLQIASFGDRIGCAEVYRNGSRIGVKFIKELDNLFMREILQSDEVRITG